MQLHLREARRSEWSASVRCSYLYGIFHHSIRVREDPPQTDFEVLYAQGDTDNLGYQVQWCIHRVTRFIISFWKSSQMSLEFNNLLSKLTAIDWRNNFTQILFPFYISVLCIALPLQLGISLLTILMGDDSVSSHSKPAHSNVITSYSISFFFHRLLQSATFRSAFYGFFAHVPHRCLIDRSCISYLHLICHKVQVQSIPIHSHSAYSIFHWTAWLHSSSIQCISVFDRLPSFQNRRWANCRLLTLFVILSSLLFIHSLGQHREPSSCHNHAQAAIRLLLYSLLELRTDRLLFWIKIPG